MNKEMYYKEMWNKSAKSNNMFVQMGRSSYSPIEFFILIKDIIMKLNLEKKDTLLDAGGGAGWISIALSGIVKEITLFDFSEIMIQQAVNNTKIFNNINCFEDNIAEMKNFHKQLFDKILVGSVFQYLENMFRVEESLKELYKISNQDTKILISQNPDISKKEEHIKSYEKLNWEKDKIESALKEEERRLWIDFEDVRKIAEQIGFSKCEKLDINKNLWQSTHMFDIILSK